MSILAKVGAFKVSTLSLPDCLEEIERYGDPSLFKDHGEWSCNVEVFVTGTGTQFKVRSDWDHKTHAEAANVCLSRLLAELKRIKEIK